MQVTLENIDSLAWKKKWTTYYLQLFKMRQQVRY